MIAKYIIGLSLLATAATGFIAYKNGSENKVAQANLKTEIAEHKSTKTKLTGAQDANALLRAESAVYIERIKRQAEEAKKVAEQRQQTALQAEAYRITKNRLEKYENCEIIGISMPDCYYELLKEAASIGAFR